ncbi:MAG: hypothetical protein II998_03025 [Clostridia bacterium]|nr:hypothetical protein [Clostridia bacterium]
MKKITSPLAPVSKLTLDFPHFPTRMQAFIFRNWESVPKERIAKALKCSVEDVKKQAQKMGLLPQKDVSVWIDRGYISIIKANWALAPYSQLLELLGWDEERLGMVLKDEDFLKFKLGDHKFLCEEITYRELTAEEEKQTKEIKELITKHFPENPNAKDEFDFFSGDECTKTNKGNQASGDIVLDNNWGIVDETGDLVCSKIIARYKKEFENTWNVSLCGSQKHIIFRLFDDKKDEEYHEIEITETSIVITGADSAAILRALVYLSDVANAKGCFGFDFGKIKRRAKFKTRIIYSFCGLYNDALDSDSTLWCPDSLLDSYSKSGINAIWIQGILYRLAHFPFDPSLSKGMEQRIEKLNILIERASLYGIKIFLYLNEPRAMEEAFFKAHPQIMGAKRRTLRSMCSSAPEVEKYVSDAVESICKSAKNLGGIFMISSSENLNNCRAWMMDEPCPKCANVPMSEIAAKVNNTITKAAHRVNPNLKVIAWDWGWRREELMDGEEVEKFVKSLVPGTIVMSGRERGIPIEKGGIKGEIEDYTLCETGIGEMARDAWRWAAESGNETAAKLQINNTWECSTIPYLPLFKTLEQILSNVEAEGVSHLMLSWTLGGAPSPNIKVASARFFETTGETAEITDVYTSLFGDDAKEVKIATDKFSDAFCEFPFAHQGIYKGPANGGAANLLYDNNTGLTATMTCFAYDDLETWRCQYPEEIYESQFEKMANMWSEGLEALKDVKDKELKAMAEATCIQLQSAANQIKFVRARNRGDHSEMAHLAKCETELAVKLHNLMDSYPQIGFEAANHYYYTKSSLKEKILNCAYIIKKYS